MGFNEVRLEKNCCYSSSNLAQAQIRDLGNQTPHNKIASERDSPGAPTSDRLSYGSEAADCDFPGALLSFHSAGNQSFINSAGHQIHHSTKRTLTRRDHCCRCSLSDNQIKASFHSAGTHSHFNPSGTRNNKKTTLTGCDLKGSFSLIDNDFTEISGYFSDFDISAKGKLGRRAASFPINQKEIKYKGSKVITRVNPKLKENFCLGKILKWGDFSRQESREMKENSNLSVLDITNDNGHISNKINNGKVYTRKYPRRLGGGNTLTKVSRPSRKDEEIVQEVCEGREAEMANEGSSSSVDDTSSEDFVITSETDVEAEKATQEQKAFEGVRCLLGEGRKEFEGVQGLLDTQVPNQFNQYVATVDHSCEEGGNFLSALNIKLIKAVKETSCDNRDAGPSFSKRSGARELRNLISNVNYEKGFSGKGKTRHQ